MDFDAAADELYGVLPSEFTARRNALAKEAGDDGDAEAAQQIRGLTKPSLAAWVTNTLVRNHRGEIDGLLELGESLREATARLSRADLAALSKQQRQVIGALVKLATADAQDAGQSVSIAVGRAVEQTLRAALGDPDAGGLLAAGRLTEPLEYVGFPGGIQPGAAPDQATGRASKPDASTRSADSEAARAARAEAEETLARAKRQHAAATENLAEADRKVELIGGHLDEVRVRVKELTGQLREAERTLRAATKARDLAHDAVEAARQRLDDVAPRR